jgi:hypothetical protein
MPSLAMRGLLAAAFVGLALWLALAVAGGLAAAAIFPAAKSLPISLAGFEAFAAERPEEARVLAAGHLVERVFDLTGLVRCTLGAMVLGALVACALAVPRVGATSQRRTKLVAIAALVAGIGLACAAVGTFVVQPEFQSQDRAYRDAARAADMVAADTLKREVDRSHLAASRTATVEVVAILLAIPLLALGALSFAAPGATASAGRPEGEGARHA